MSEKRNAKAVLFVSPDEDHDFAEHAPAGAFRWSIRYGDETKEKIGLHFKCPCGCGAVYGATFDTPKAEGIHGPRWHWDGNTEAPTITPSLGCHVTHDGQTRGADGYHWHGYLRAGIFEEC